MSSQATFSIGGEIEVRRLGFGAMRITGPPGDRAAALRLLRRAVDLGVELVDTADAYGPGVSEELVAEALAPYRGLCIATKGGYERTGAGGLSANGELVGWTPNGRPEHLRVACEASLRRLGVERIDLYQLHTPDPAVPYVDSIGALSDLQIEGKVRHVGVSNVTFEQLAVARSVADIATVQNRLDLTSSGWRDMLAECESGDVGFIPYRPLRAWDSTISQGILKPAASRHSATTGQIALAWLLAASPVTLPIPGTATAAHLEENVAAGDLYLDEEEIEAITAAVFALAPE
jgi:pyridoxine 4-dehydrogenase